jgi:hypothetical protein
MFRCEGLGLGFRVYPFLLDNGSSTFLTSKDLVMEVGTTILDFMTTDDA